MPIGETQFSAEELVRVLSHYDVGVIRHVSPLAAGDRRAPKMVIISDRGKFLLKRRPTGVSDLYQVALAHAVQGHLSKRFFPVTRLMTTCDEKNTIVKLGDHIYEFFRFAQGTRYDGSYEATADTGGYLARFHQHLRDFAYRPKKHRSSFHNSDLVMRNFERVTSRSRGGELAQVSDRLKDVYEQSCERVNGLGFDQWPRSVVHGDWHPGNMLFSERKLAAVLDFDSIGIAPQVTDLANGMLQFSIVGDRPNPADWPDYLDQAKLTQFLNGYRRVIPLDYTELCSLLELMKEALISEAITPIAATGRFGNLNGIEFLKMVHRKAAWIDCHHEKLMQAIET